MSELINNKHIKSVTFTAGLNKDMDPQSIQEGQYTHAINSQLNSKNGEIPFLSNEEGTKFCTEIPYTYIGNIPLENKRFVIFSTDNTNSEIGIFDEVSCSYNKLINAKCLNFSTKHLIRGVSKKNFDCTESIYWCDDYNNNRYLNLNNIPYTYTFADDTCKTKIFTDKVDCNELELNPLIKIPNVLIKKSKFFGTLPNGSYQAVMAYSVKGESVTDFYGVTKPVSIFSHENLGAGLEIELVNIDSDFKEYNLYVIVTIAQQTTVYLIGSYSTSQNKVSVSNIKDTTTQIPLNNIFLQRVINSKAENVLSINNQLLWSSPTTKKDLDYQLIANKIKVNWVAYAVPIAEKDSGDIQSFMRDEVYSFSIGWKYTDGSRTNKYPLIGRTATKRELELSTSSDAYEISLKNCDRVSSMKHWQVVNTATGNVDLSPIDKCEYKIVGTGDFAYHESTEKYPDNKNTFGNLACTPIRHFRFPDDSIVPRTIKNNNGDVTHVIHLGITLSNIGHPLDNNGEKLENIQGFEVFRGDRSVEKTILGKGLIFNMGEYNLLTNNKGKNTKALYANYPYNDLRTDKFLSLTQTKGAIKKEQDYTPMGTFSDLYYTFHSPSFSFSKPSFGNELKVEGIDSGKVLGTFSDVYNHPKNKLITDVGFAVSTVLGLGEAYLATREQITETRLYEAFNLGIGAGTGTAGTVVPPAAITGGLAGYIAGISATKAAGLISGQAEDTAKASIRSTLATTVTGALAVPYSPGRYSIQETRTSSLISSIPKALRLLNDIYLFSMYFQQGTETGLNFIRSFAKGEQYALQVNSVCKYRDFIPSKNGNKRRYISDISYLYPTMQMFDGITINNYKRESAVILKLNSPLTRPSVKDTSRQTITQAEACKSKKYEAVASSYYASIKQKLPSQYGQVENIKWLDTGYYNYIDSNNISSTYSSDIILGGDTFISKFSIKRKFNYFNQQAINEKDDFEFNYKKYINIPYPRYWMDSTPYDLSEFVSINPQLPNDKFNLDCKISKRFGDKLKTPFIVRDRYFYTSNNGVLDFYVESEFNLDNRDWEENNEFRHYDEERFSDLNTLFRADYAEFDNRYIYDKSYSKQLLEHIGFTQNIHFDPNKEETCFTKLNNKVYWSLPSTQDQTVDYWRQYLINNFYEFPEDAGSLTGMKSLDRTNIAFFFNRSGPYIHQAIDQLQTDSGIKVTLGDGGLFARQPQPIISTDINYGASQTKFAYTQSQFGVIYPSSSNGSVYLLQGNSLKDISKYRMHFWFKNNMQFNILTDFPNYKNIDNTVDGVGYLTSYDNTKELFYLTKIDFKVKENYKNILVYDENKDYFYIRKKTGHKTIISFKDPFYFDDCSWTLSYSPNFEAWISFHDWHPNSIIQTENHFIGITNETKDRKCTLWKHNESCSNYCNYYGKQYSWDIEYVINNMQNTSILSNIEYNLEAYVYDKNCLSRHHILDENFTKAIIYNTEQVSGQLNLNLASKNKLSAVLFYPKINTNYIDIEYHKEEQKYRFNQFWDAAKNRAEFNNNRVSMHIYENNGYRYSLNPDYINYNKPPFERKKLRHNWFKVYFSKEVPKDISMPNIIVKFFNNKETNSIR